MILTYTFWNTILAVAGVPKFYGPEWGLVLFRKYAARYLTPYHLPKAIRKQLFTCETAAEFTSLLDEIEALAPNGRKET